MLLGCASTKSHLDQTTVKDVDLEKYMGKWYEIARFENKFQKGMEGVTAEYTILEDGKIEVLNSGYQGSLSGEKRSKTGKAKCPDLTKPGNLKVSFFLWFYSDYLILDLDQENYSYALVAGSDDKYLWILSRTPELDKDVLDTIIQKAKAKGYDVNKLRFCKH